MKEITGILIGAVIGKIVGVIANYFLGLVIFGGVIGGFVGGLYAILLFIGEIFDIETLILLRKNRRRIKFLGWVVIGVVSATFLLTLIAKAWFNLIGTIIFIQLLCGVLVGFLFREIFKIASEQLARLSQKSFGNLVDIQLTDISLKLDIFKEFVLSSEDLATLVGFGVGAFLGLLMGLFGFISVDNISSLVGAVIGGLQTKFFLYHSWILIGGVIGVGLVILTYL